MTILVRDRANAMCQSLDEIARLIEIDVSDLRDNWQGNGRHITCLESRYLKLMTNFWQSIKQNMTKFEELAK